MALTCIFPVELPGIEPAALPGHIPSGLPIRSISVQRSPRVDINDAIMGAALDVAVRLEIGRP